MNRRDAIKAGIAAATGLAAIPASGAMVKAQPDIWKIIELVSDEPARQLGTPDILWSDEQFTWEQVDNINRLILEWSRGNGLAQ